MTTKKKPQRMCVICREMKDKSELIRIVKTLDDGLVIDATGKINGRGAYICKAEECLLKAKKSKGLDKSLKVNVPDEIYEKLQKGL